MLPRTRIAEVLGEVYGWTEFVDRFNHLRTGNLAADNGAAIRLYRAPKVPTHSIGTATGEG